MWISQTQEQVYDLWNAKYPNQIDNKFSERGDLRDNYTKSRPAIGEGDQLNFCTAQENSHKASKEITAENSV